MSSPPATGITTIECGRPFRLPATGSLALSGRFPTVASSAVGAVSGTVEVSSRVAVKGVVGPRADMFLVRDGRVATVPAPQDAVGIRWELSPGTAKRLPGEIVLGSCAADGGAMAAGTYELYARVAVIADSGAVVEAFGGPWPFEVR